MITEIPVVKNFIEKLRANNELTQVNRITKNYPEAQDALLTVRKLVDNEYSSDS